ncbi:MAG: hypothetical protein JF588_03135 [Caulobacterales bacterium]|nr:hypothetical protein [Caulobacterales bacterium]
MPKLVSGALGASRWARLAGVVAYLTVMLLVAAASFHGAYEKWGFRDGAKRFGVEAMLAGTAYRPFVYRALNPWIANAVVEVTPPPTMAALRQRSITTSGHSKIGPDRIAIAPPATFVRYNLLYYLTFLEWYVAVLAMAALGAHYTGRGPGAAASAILALAMPILMSGGGYFYDTTEVMFLAVATYAAVRGWFPLLAAAAVIGAVNKETMVLFLPTLLPFVRQRMKTTTTTAVLTCALMIGAALAHALVRSFYYGNPGVEAEVHLFENLRWYLDPRTLLGVEKTYGLLLFSPYSPLFLGLVLILGISGWRSASPAVRQHAALALAVNIPLFLALGFKGELRGLSLAYPAWTILSAVAVRNWMLSAAAQPLPHEASPRRFDLGLGGVVARLRRTASASGPIGVSPSPRPTRPPAG